MNYILGALSAIITSLRQMFTRLEDRSESQWWDEQK